MQFRINGSRIKLDQSQLIQSGGEGMVFEFGSAAVKLYHHPQSHHEAKLIDWISGPMRTQVPANVLGPDALVSGRSGEAVGFKMPRLARGMAPMKRLANPLFWKKNNVSIRDAIPILQEIRSTLHGLHLQGVVVGDLNDSNVFFQQPLDGAKPAGPRTQWIDVDSFQFGRHLCRVALEAFLDPLLYDVGSLSCGQYFSPSTDWYAFLTLLVKSVLQVHPYGGVHRKHKTLRARAMNQISILDPKVTYPKAARPLECLSDELLHHLHLVFDQGKRLPFPKELLREYAGSLIDCPCCEHSAPSNRAGCPACRHRTFVPQSPLTVDDYQLRTLLKIDGFIEHVHVRPSGRIMVVKREGTAYSLVLTGPGGSIDEKALFQGGLGYRFSLFGDQLVVNPPNGNRLLIIDVAGASPRKLYMTETASFLDRAVFGSTHKALYRIAGSWIMRGTLQRGHFVEEAVDMAHRAQSLFWASAYDDLIAGYHRVFGDQIYFITHGSGKRYEIVPPPLANDERSCETKIMFGPGTVALARLVVRSGRFHRRTHVCGLDGSFLLENHQEVGAAADDDLHPEPFPFTTDASLPRPPFIRLPWAISESGDCNLLLHPTGTLIHRPHQLQIAIKTS